MEMRTLGRDGKAEMRIQFVIDGVQAVRQLRERAEKSRDSKHSA
jgi:hypothetical protein